MDSTAYAHLSPGTVFARDFRIVRPLSHGGMGAVYVAMQISTGRERALKLMHPKLVLDPKQRRRFEQEAQVGARIESAHVVEVVGAGVDDETGAPWLCMELLRGRDLAATAAAHGPMSPADVLAIMRQLCHAVAAGHAAGVVHRDLKPENVFLATSRQAGVPFVVKVLDFGIAKMVAEGMKNDTSPIGTPLWMAPEQTVAGGAIGPQTDVWALGLIAFKLLSGRSYWRGAADEASSPITLLREIAFEPLEAASMRARELGAAELPAGFDAWFERCVVREIERRFADATAALEGLESVLAGARPGAPAPTVGDAAPADPSMPTDAFVAERGLDVQGNASSLGGLAHTVDPSPKRKATTDPRRISGLEATEPAPPPAMTPRPRAEDADIDEAEAAASLPKPGRASRVVLVAVAAIALAGGGLGIRKMRNDAAQTAAAASAEAARLAREKDEARAVEEGKIKLAERRAQLDTLLGKMARIQPTTFAMGSDEHDNDEKPVVRRALPGFEIDLREVTVAAYRACVTANGCKPPATGGHCNWDRADRITHPVNCVDHSQAAAFCAWAAKRLPTEDEWELAARGPDARIYPWGASAPSSEACFKRLDRARDHGEGTCTSGEKRGGESPFGLVDVAGNVREWTSSAYCPYANRECSASSRVLRGGSWRDDDPLLLRTSARSKLPPHERPDDAGFRCARDALY